MRIQQEEAERRIDRPTVRSEWSQRPNWPWITRGPRAPGHPRLSHLPIGSLWPRVPIRSHAPGAARSTGLPGWPGVARRPHAPGLALRAASPGRSRLSDGPLKAGAARWAFGARSAGVAVRSGAATVALWSCTGLRWNVNSLPSNG